MLVILCLGVCLTLPAEAPPPPSRAFRQGSAVLTLAGDRLENNLLGLRYSNALWLIVEVGGPQGLEVADFKAEIDAQVWQVLRQTPGETVPTPDGAQQWRKSIFLDPIKPGKVPAPAVSLRYRDGPEEAWKSVKWPGVEVEVVGPDDADTNDIRGVPPLETLPEKAPWWRPFIPLFVAVVSLAVGILLARWWLRRSRPAVVVPPEQRALRELEQLERSAPPANAAPDWYHTRLSEIVRRYLEERFAFRASRQTTQEFLQDVQQRPELAEAQRHLLRDLLLRCDLAKFTGLSPAPAEQAEAAALARDLVLQTAPPAGSPRKGGGGGDNSVLSR